MVQTRRSLSKSPKAPSESTPRSRRQQTRNALRSQSTGVGIVIESKAKKIVFDEEGNAPSLALPEPVVKPALTVGDDDDDDDAVEEVKASDAKLQIQEQRSLERSTARESLLGQKRKRSNNKSKKEDELDDDFFAQLDAEMEQQNKEKKQKKTAPQGKLITFVAKDEVAQNKRPIQKEHNIQLVVLNDRPHRRSGPPLPLAGGSSSSSYSRLHINNGQDELSAKQLQKMKKTGRKVEQTWTRSNQVNQRLLLGKQIPQTKSSPNANRTVVIRL